MRKQPPTSFIGPWLPKLSFTGTDNDSLASLVPKPTSALVLREFRVSPREDDLVIVLTQKSKQEKILVEEDCARRLVFELNCRHVNHNCFSTVTMLKSLFPLLYHFLLYKRLGAMRCRVSRSLLARNMKSGLKRNSISIQCLQRHERIHRQSIDRLNARKAERLYNTKSKLYLVE